MGSLSVAKHSYIKGAKGKMRARAHVNYILHRPGEDRERGAREFFDKRRENITGVEVKRDIEAIERAPVVVHKLILSPGVEGVDMQRYTREVLHDVGRQKGLDLDWRAVVHQNTDHQHAHVIVFGKDENGRVVKFNRDDYRLLREAGDRFLEREHFFERFRDKDMERLVSAKEKEYERHGDWTFQQLVDEINAKPGLKKEREQEKQPDKELQKELPEWSKEEAIARLPDKEKIRVGDELYSKFSTLEELKDLRSELKHGQVERLDADKFEKLRYWIETKERRGDDYHDSKAKEKWDKKHRPDLDIEEHRRIEEELKRGYADPERQRGKGRKQHLQESRGRLAEDHGHYVSIQEQKRLKELLEAHPERKEEIEKQLEQVKQYDREQRQEARPNWNNFDALLGERWKSIDQEREEKQRGEAKATEKGQERDDASASKTFEAHRQARDQKEIGEPDKEQEKEREDDTFGPGSR